MNHCYLAVSISKAHQVLCRQVILRAFFTRFIEGDWQVIAVCREYVLLQKQLQTTENTGVMYTRVKKI